MQIPTQAKQTVAPKGERVLQGIDGVKIYSPPTHQDDRGSLCEIYSESWNFDKIPVVHTYLVTIRPGKVKGWALHDKQIDRYFFASGSVKLVLFDGRENSCTHGLINELYFSEVNRSLVSVPSGIYHAVENVGLTDALMFNLPSQTYCYESPDKKLLPLENDLIPYRFDPKRGY